MDGKSSLDLLIELNQTERQLQLAHFDSLDTKAGLVLGFAGVLIVLGNGSGPLAGIGQRVCPCGSYLGGVLLVTEICVD